MNDETRTAIMKTAIELYDKGNDKVSIIIVACQLHPTMETEMVGFVVESAIEMLQSFTKTINTAGGVVQPINKLLEMTFMDLVSSLATNGVRFIYEERGN